MADREGLIRLNGLWGSIQLAIKWLRKQILFTKHRHKDKPQHYLLRYNAIPTFIDL